MSASLQEQERELLIVLLPSHQPVGLNVAFPYPMHIARKFVRTILWRQRTVCFKQVHRIGDEFHVEPSPDAALEVFFELGRQSDLICHGYSPISFRATKL